VTLHYTHTVLISELYICNHVVSLAVTRCCLLPFKHSLVPAYMSWRRYLSHDLYVGTPMLRREESKASVFALAFTIRSFWVNQAKDMSMPTRGNNRKRTAALSSKLFGSTCNISASYKQDFVRLERLMKLPSLLNLLTCTKLWLHLQTLPAQRLHFLYHYFVAWIYGSEWAIVRQYDMWYSPVFISVCPILGHHESYPLPFWNHF
jgi:hypothetical protein